MTTLTHDPLQGDLLDEIALVADEWSPLGKLAMADFRAACWAEARKADGWVDMNKVRAHFFRDGAWLVDERSYSAKWAPACGPRGFMDKTDRPLPISGAGSRGNSNKASVWRRWRGYPAAAAPP